MGPLPPVSPLPSCQNVSFGGIREVDDVEEFFKYMNKKVFNDKIKQGYLNFKK
jgi:hypothetical protein